MYENRQLVCDRSSFFAACDSGVSRMLMRILGLSLIATLAIAQHRTNDQGFCPPKDAKVDPAITLLDDLCSAKPANGYRLEQQAPPLSFGQKASYFAQHKILSASSMFSAAFLGAVAQVRHDPHEWPQGAEGFGDRF